MRLKKLNAAINAATFDGLGVLDTVVAKLPGSSGAIDQLTCPRRPTGQVGSRKESRPEIA